MGGIGTALAAGVGIGAGGGVVVSTTAALDVKGQWDFLAGGQLTSISADT